MNRTGRVALLALLALLGIALWASDGGCLLGTIRDPTGTAVPWAEVGNGNGHSPEADHRNRWPGFLFIPESADWRLRRRGRRLRVQASPAHRCRDRCRQQGYSDATLVIGEKTEAITVSESAAHVQTVDTQVGQVITGKQMTAVPLNGRSYTDLLALQSGVVPVTSLTSDTTQDVGVSAFSPSGDLSPGTVLINGQREFANSFVLNGSDVEEDVNMGTAIIPNVDSVAEFWILTSNFDAEYGEFSGGQINVVTKSGTNALHGDVFEFLRSTDLDARNYFSPTCGAFDQNQFGGTLGGPIRRNKVFFFADYQGTRLTQGVDTGEIPVPSLQDRSGNQSDVGSSFTNIDQNGKSVPTTVTGSYWANSFRRSQVTV
jgi:hypothetical protein